MDQTNRMIIEDRRPTPAARRFRIRAPSRLHLGLLSFGQASGRQFGGLGVMIREPGVEVEWTEAARFLVAGPHAGRAEKAASIWSSFYDIPLPDAQVQIVHSPPHHVGLGVGTQLALSMAAGLHFWFGIRVPPPCELARSVQRGRRSAVGVHGFLEGGLIAERGKLLDESLSPLDCRLDLPDTWRVVLVRPTGGDGLSGLAEHAAFEQLPAVPLDVTRRLTDEARLHLLPAAAAGDFEAFSSSVYRFGRQAGDCFAAIQGGSYNGQRLANLVTRMRRIGVTGVGQSSWGPTLYAFLPNEREAADFASRMRIETGDKSPDGSLDIVVTRVDNEGARVIPYGEPSGGPSIEE